jgi:RHS repeat-associated protein
VQPHPFRKERGKDGAPGDSIVYQIVNTDWDQNNFSKPSFPASVISGDLAGGADSISSGKSTQRIYSYAGSYDGVSNLTAYTDSVMGTLGFGYDTLNRLVTGTPSSGSYAGKHLCWSYDAFGNRTAQSIQSSACSSGVTATARYNGSNQVTWTQVNVAVNGFSYDAAGNVTYDGVNQYLYDGEGRICAMASTPAPGLTTMTGYLYDADGTRVAKGTINAWSCDLSTNGFQTTNDYILGLAGEQAAEMNVTVSKSATTITWAHTNVWAGGRLLATYDATGPHFYLDDPLGTRRVQATAAGIEEQRCQSLPYGDGETCAPTPTEHLFTGKERDTESGNDYFSARYYSSAMGRFMSPDPIIMNDLRMINPQRWNKYAYVINNPLILTDPTGKDAAYVNFSGMANGFGHAGVMSIHHDGSATFSYKDGDGKIHMDDSLPKVQFDANGLPTAASYASLAKAVADFDTAPGQTPIDPASVGIDYFKTTDAETAALDQYIAQRWGNDQFYFPIWKSCLDYAVGGLNAAGVTNRVPYARHFTIPNNFWLWLEPQADSSKNNPEGHPKRHTTVPCLKNRDGSCAT